MSVVVKIPMLEAVTVTATRRPDYSTAEGEIGVRVPQVRGAGEPYHSKLIEFLKGNSKALERLVTEMYARGLSTRDVEDCFKDLTTGESLLSRRATENRPEAGRSC